MPGFSFTLIFDRTGDVQKILHIKVNMSVSESLRSSEPGSNVGVRWNPGTSHLPTQSIAANLPNSWNEAVTPAASFGKERGGF